MAVNYRQLHAIRNNNRKRILKACPHATEQSGIYILTRYEDGFKYAYVGQAQNILSRLADHLSGYQHIDLSIKKHKFWSEDNGTGWRIDMRICPENELDEQEQAYIKQLANCGFQMRNKTSGGQGEGKKKIAEYKPAKGYQDGLKQGYKNAQRDVAKWAKWLEITADHRKNAQKALEKLNKFLGD